MFSFLRESRALLCSMDYLRMRVKLRRFLMEKNGEFITKTASLKELLKDILQGRGKLSQNVCDVRSNSKQNKMHLKQRYRNFESQEMPERYPKEAPVAVWGSSSAGSQHGDSPASLSE